MDNAAPKQGIECRYLTQQMVMSYLSVSRTTLFRWIKADKIPYIQGPFGYRFDKEEIDEWMKSNHMSSSEKPVFVKF